MDKLGVRKLKRKQTRRAASKKQNKRWQAASLFLVIAASIAALCVALINSGAKSGPAPGVEPPLRAGPRFLTNAGRSAEELAREFLDALQSSDEDRIKSLRITKSEFCEYVWPELPSSRLSNVSCDWAWDQATLKSLSGLSEMLPRHKGKRYELVSLRFAGGIENYLSYRVHKKPMLTVKDRDGSEKEMRLFGSMLEMDGQFKLFSFVID